MQVRTLSNDTVDSLCWRHLGKTAGMTEIVLSINPGVCDYGPILPQGIIVEIPDAPPASTATATIVKLWE